MTQHAVFIIFTTDVTAAARALVRYLVSTELQLAYDIHMEHCTHKWNGPSLASC